MFPWRCWKWPQFSTLREYTWPLVIPYENHVSFLYVHSEPKNTSLLWSILRWWNKRLSWVCVEGIVKASAGWHLWFLKRALLLPYFSGVVHKEALVPWSSPLSWVEYLNLLHPSWCFTHLELEAFPKLPEEELHVKLTFLKSYLIFLLFVFTLFCLWNPYIKLDSFYQPVRCFLATKADESSKTYFIPSWNQANACPEFCFVRVSWRAELGKIMREPCLVWRKCSNSASAARNMRCDDFVYKKVLITCALPTLAMKMFYTVVPS